MELNEYDYEVLEHCSEILHIDGHNGLYSKLNAVIRKIKRD